MSIVNWLFYGCCIVSNNCQRKVCENVWEIHKWIKNLFEGHTDPIKRVSAHKLNYKLKEILHQVQLAITKSNQDYEIVLNRLYVYYNKKLVTFGIDSPRNLIIQFPVFIRLYTQTKLTLYQVETVLVPILDTGNKIQSYPQLKIEKLYIALNDETYITIQPQELNNCKKIGYEYSVKNSLSWRVDTDTLCKHSVF